MIESVCDAEIFRVFLCASFDGPFAIYPPRSYAFSRRTFALEPAMTQDNEYDLKSPETPPKPKPGDPGWVEPTPIIEKADPVAEEPAVSPEDLDVTNNKAMAIL